MRFLTPSSGSGAECLPDVARALARGFAAGLPLVDAFARGADGIDGAGGVAMRLCADEGLADRERLRLEARAATAQARIAARIVPLAPIASLAMLLVIAPASAHALLATPPGVAIIGVASVMTGLAVMVLRRIAHGAGL